MSLRRRNFIVGAAGVATMSTSTLDEVDSPSIRKEAEGSSKDFRESVSVKDFGAVGDGKADDTLAIQSAVEYCRTHQIGILRFPAALPRSFFKITASIKINFPLVLEGLGENSTQVIAYGLRSGQYIFDFECRSMDNVEHAGVKMLTVRSDNGKPSGVRLKNVSYIVVSSLRLYALKDGIVIEGTRCFSHSYYGLNSVLIDGATVLFSNGFSGGGQYAFFGCTFVGRTGVTVPATATLDNLSFAGCNWEDCISFGLDLQGTIAGVSVAGCRTERGKTHDFLFRPANRGSYIAGVSISGTVFSASDSSLSDRIVLGGAFGRVSGFQISGNVVTHGADQFGGKLVALNGEVGSGTVSGNVIRGRNEHGAGAVNSNPTEVSVFGNENISGLLD